MSTPDIPAGWQPDPRGRHEYRYWDGTQWTDHVSDQGQVSTDPVADTTPEASDAEKSQIFSAESATPAAEEPTEVQPAASDPAPEPAAADPAPVAREPEPAPEPTSAPAGASTAPPGMASAPAASTPAAAAATPAASTPVATEPSTPQSDAKAAAQDVLKSKSPELATILTAAVPGSGHFYLGTDKVPLAAGLLAATLVAVILSHMSFLFFVIGFAIWAGAVVFGLTDLRGSAAAVTDVALPKNVVGVVLIGAGALLIISLLLPYYRVSIDAGEFGSGGGSVNAFDAFDFEHIILLAVGVISIVGGAASLGLGPVSAGDLPRWMPQAIAIGGAIAVLLILFRMFIDNADTGGFSTGGVDVNIGRAFGMWLGLWSAILLTLANIGLLKSLADKQRQTA